MAVFKNYYNRKPKSYLNGWCQTLSCLYLLCSTINCSVVSGERTRHHHTNKPQTDVYVSQLEKSALEDGGGGSKTPAHICPNCLYKTDRELKSESDNLRLEAIKRQILSKLGLRHKPNVTQALPRELIEKTYRTINGERQEEEYYSTTSAKTTNYETVDVDDYYGRTSEIISFAEQGFRVNGNRLLDFRVNAQLGRAGQEFKVKSATLWLKADIRHSRTNKCKSTEVYVFKFKTSLGRDVKLSSQEFNDYTEDPISLTLEESKTGWQKVDLTETVKKWLTSSNKEKLRLLVDCSCCSNWQIHLLNREMEKKADPNRPFLVIETDPTTAKRVRRRAMDCSPDSGNQCCKQPFYVSFETLGWKEWIIAPSGYYANYCRGDCGHHRTPDTYVTYHTHVIEELKKTYHLSGMQPCCAPLKFSSISLIYYDSDHNVIKRDLPKMVVDECGCP